MALEPKPRTALDIGLDRYLEQPEAKRASIPLTDADEYEYTLAADSYGVLVVQLANRLAPGERVEAVCERYVKGRWQHDTSVVFEYAPEWDSDVEHEHELPSFDVPIAQGKANERFRFRAVNLVTRAPAKITGQITPYLDDEP